MDGHHRSGRLRGRGRFGSVQEELIVVPEVKDTVAPPAGELVNDAELSEFGERAIRRGLADAKTAGEGTGGGGGLGVEQVEHALRIGGPFAKGLDLRRGGLA